MSMLVQSRAFLEYVVAVLIEERSSLNNQYVFNFMVVFFPKVSLINIILDSRQCRSAHKICSLRRLGCSPGPH